MLITIQEFADLHGVDKKTIEYRMRVGQLDWTEKYGRRLINSRAKFKKTNRGRK